MSIQFEEDSNAEHYDSFIHNAASLVRESGYSIEDIETAGELPTNVERVRHCVELTLESAEELNDDPEPKQYELPTDVADIDWPALFEEFGLFNQSGYNCASATQLAGAMAVSDHTGYRPTEIDRSSLRDRVEHAADEEVGVLKEVEREGAVVGYLPKEVFGDE